MSEVKVRLLSVETGPATLVRQTFEETRGALPFLVGGRTGSLERLADAPACFRSDGGLDWSMIIALPMLVRVGET